LTLLVTKNVCTMKPPPKVGEDDMVIVQDVPAFVAKLAFSERLRVPALVAYLPACVCRKSSRFGGATLISTRRLFRCAALEPTKAHGIRFKAPKSKAGRRDITLPDILVAALREYRKAQLELRMKLGAGRLPDDALLFGDINGNPVPPNVISAAWSDFAASKRVGMPELTFHALRHTHASQLIDANVDIVTISKRLGHAKPDITLRITLTCSARMTARPRPRSMRFWVRRVPIGCQYSIFVLIGGSAKALKPLRRKGGRAV